MTDTGRGMWWVRRLISWSRYFVVLAVFALFLAFVALMVSEAITTVTAIVHAIAGDLTQKELVGRLVQQADTALLAMVLYVISLGLYSLFVDDRIPMPAWLRIHALGDLKELLASVVIVVIAVLFLGYALTWTGGSDLLTLGISSGVVIAALAFFLWTGAAQRGRHDREQGGETEPGPEGDAQG